MKNLKETVKETVNHIRIRLDRKTIITLKDMTRFDYWKGLYPNLQIIS